MIASIYIPLIAQDVNEAYVVSAFHTGGIGKVSHVDFVINKQKMRREAFVHFEEWYDTDEANALKTQLECGKETGQNTRFKHSKLKYWPLLVNKNPLEKNSPLKQANAVYELEERFLNLERMMTRLTFMTKLHDANIRLILENSAEAANNSGNNNNGNENGSLKRLKVDAETYIYTDGMRVI